jgi:hypothetical protein
MPIHMPAACERKLTAICLPLSCKPSCKQALTWAAYIHVAFQPLVVNLYFLWGQVGIQYALSSISDRSRVIWVIWKLFKT